MSDKAKGVCIIPKCGMTAQARGLCIRCLSGAKFAIDFGLTTWDELEALGLVATKNRPGVRRKFQLFAEEFRKRKRLK